ncbi:MAG: hypothetical protein GY847_07030, partial [Proteobacteria bacterium]|nr:hypothetical protein [Pseudomonadota bacterium]
MMSIAKEQSVIEMTDIRDHKAELNALKVEYEHAMLDAQRRTTQATLVYQIGQRISEELEAETLLSEIVNAARDAF